MSSLHFHPWHRGSLFGPGPRRLLDRDQRARFRFLLNAHARANRLPAKQEKVGLALLKHLGVNGQCDPSHDTLAADSGTSSRTVRRATATLRRLGLLRWQTRLVRTEWRAEQTSNAYELVPTAENPAISCGGQTGRETLKKNLSSMQLPALQVFHHEQQEARAALERIAAQRQHAILELLKKGRG